MNKSQYKLSIVNYTNTLPFRWALKKSNLMHRIDLQEDIPSICAQKLQFEQVDIALIPVAFIPELKQSFVISNYCIGANGKVDSVKLYSKVPLEKIKTIVLDYQSKTSITLTKLLCRDFWKIQPKFIDAKPGFEAEITGATAAVVIGDRTFSMNGTFEYEYDLAEEWLKFTSLPFVFAAWVSTRPIDEKFMTEFDEVLKHGVENISTSVEELNKPDLISNESANNYLTKSISFQLDEEKKKALNLFLDKIKNL